MNRQDEMTGQWILLNHLSPDLLFLVVLTPYRSLKYLSVFLIGYFLRIFLAYQLRPLRIPFPPEHRRVHPRTLYNPVYQLSRLNQQRDL